MLKHSILGEHSIGDEFQTLHRKALSRIEFAVSYSANLTNLICMTFLLQGPIHVLLFFSRSEQDKEPEPEIVLEVTGAGPSEESTSDGM